MQTKWNRYLRTKTTAIEDRNYESINHVVKLDWDETDVKRECCTVRWCDTPAERSLCVWL